MANKKKCPNCGFVDERGDSFFCTECGTKMVEEAGFESESAQNNQETQYNQNVQNNQNTQNDQNASYNYNAQSNQGTQYNQNAQNQGASHNQNAQNNQYGYNVSPKKSSGGTKAVVIISCVCTAVCVIAVAAVLLFMWQKDAKTESADEADRKAVEEQDAKSLEDDEEDDSEEDSVKIKKNRENKNTTQEKEEEKPVASEISAYSDADLLAAARAYYQAGHGQMPPYVEIDSRNGNEIVIHLYEDMGDHIVTWEWYTVNAYTGQGYNFTYESIDIMHPETAKVESAESEYILPDSNSRYLQMSDLAGLTADECRIARNELFARHGRMFNDADLQAYFNSKSWYHGTISPDAFNDNVFNEYEVANRDLIIKYEKEQGYR